MTGLIIKVAHLLCEEETKEAHVGFKVNLERI
jgi:hypothetical protein